MWLPRFLSLPNSVPHCSHFSAHSSTILSVLSSQTFCTERVNCACYLLGAQYVLISCLLPPNPCQAPTHFGNSAKCWWKCSKRKREILTEYWTNTCYIQAFAKPSQFSATLIKMQQKNRKKYWQNNWTNTCYLQPLPSSHAPWQLCQSSDKKAPDNWNIEKKSGTDPVQSTMSLIAAC